MESNTTLVLVIGRTSTKSLRCTRTSLPDAYPLVISTSTVVPLLVWPLHTSVLEVHEAKQETIPTIIAQTMTINNRFIKKSWSFQLRTVIEDTVRNKMIWVNCKPRSEWTQCWMDYQQGMLVAHKDIQPHFLVWLLASLWTRWLQAQVLLLSWDRN